MKKTFSTLLVLSFLTFNCLAVLAEEKAPCANPDCNCACHKECPIDCKCGCHEGKDCTCDKASEDCKCHQKCDENCDCACHKQAVEPKNDENAVKADKKSKKLKKSKKVTKDETKVPVVEKTAAPVEQSTVAPSEAPVSNTIETTSTTEEKAPIVQETKTNETEAVESQKSTQAEDKPIVIESTGIDK